ncbi:hypothetical protein A6V36_23895 [Paraburkholderia ginsengiterrae]|uniref:Uncharacterized protein n=1 Tax=Paraburkholderia ginsengiterrae TaxID=1462993 RepID=A0A1A9NBC5_9BURK|nr:hypothetical protein A6V36_23895 [Paraburkholderia ginsengiterrae]OAJ62828.1 hypothetical protein A6V37_21675 [Paraburkholderia ginsengiterrae]
MLSGRIAFDRGGQISDWRLGENTDAVLLRQCDSGAGCRVSLAAKDKVVDKRAAARQVPAMKGAVRTAPPAAWT